MNSGMCKMAIRAFLLLGLVLASSACSVKGNIEDQTLKSLLPAMSTQTGMIAGSAQNQVVNGYKVSVSIGDNMAGMQQTVNGYTFMQSVQGNLNSETFTAVYQ